MAARAFQYAESLASSADTGATYLTKTSVTFTPDASSDYAIFASALIQNVTNLTSDAKCRVQDTTNTVTYHEWNVEMKDLTDWHSVHGVAVFTSSASPGSTTYAIQIAEESAATINIKEARILIIKLHADDEWVYTAGNSDTTSSTLVDGQTLTFTPATSGDYLIVSSCDHANISNGDPYTVSCLDPATGLDYSVMDARVPKDPTNFMAYSTMIKKTLAASSQTCKIRFKNDPGLGDTIRLRNRCILAIRLDTLDNQYYSETRGRTTSTSTTYQNGATITQTPLNLQHAVFACGLIDGSSATLSNFMQLLKTATQKTEMTQESQTPNDAYSWMHFEAETLAASSTTWTVQAKSETASTTTGRYDMAIAILQLDATPAAAGGAVYERKDYKAFPALLQM